MLSLKWLASQVSYLIWKLKKMLRGKTKEEPSCPHGCGVPLKHHAWSDCGDTQAALRTISEPTSEKARAFYDRVGPKAPEENPDPLHGADGFSSVYRGPGGSTITE
ncbi:MAG: hypothetical protein M0P64_01565 [Candidatus Pacebacteria bacterium]|jgi:hypothetical protein|nr:hypothetical protein [Candidatus Paceibacterota bacterium]